jgi:hypothetical protein
MAQRLVERIEVGSQRRDLVGNIVRSAIAGSPHTNTPWLTAPPKRLRAGIVA